MQNNYTVEITLANNKKIKEEIKAENELQAIDIAYDKYKDKKIIDIKII